MHAMMPLLKNTDFPSLKRGQVDTLQINLGYKCNQACFHCHVNAGPTRTESMDLTTANTVLNFAQQANINTIDITGGAPEMNPHFKYIIETAYRYNIHAIDRCNLTILEEPGYESLADFLAEYQVEIIASLPCYLEDNVNAQRGNGVFNKSISAIKKLNDVGYGKPDSGLLLNLVYNPIGPYLPPAQSDLETSYKHELSKNYGVEFNQLFTITNMPIARFGSTLVSKGEFDNYMNLLKQSYKAANLKNVMCKSLISVDYRGYIYDCDFNQMLNIPLTINNKPLTHISDLMSVSLTGNIINVADHCYGCTAGQGSSCGGALD